MIDESLVIRAAPTRVFAAFFDPAALAAWWLVTRSVTTPRPLGVYAVAWDTSAHRDEVLGPLGGVFHGRIVDIRGGQEFFVADAWWLPPEGPPLGPMGLDGKLLNAAFHSVMPRTAGFNSLDLAAFREETLVLNYVLMFIGGGSAGTAGGIKVTTFFVLLAIVASEVLRRRDASMFGRRFGHSVERQALTIAVLALGMILVATMYITSVTPLPLQDVLFEAVSAFATVGLSTGITASLPNSALLVLALLMFVGRVGTITAATALALRHGLPYRYPEENPIVG